MKDKSPNLTDYQNDLCFEVKFALIRGILNISNDVIWAYVSKAVDKMFIKRPKGDKRDD